MNGTPRSHRALCLAAIHCTHPELDGIDKSLLSYLANYGDFRTGKNSRPGNANISDALGLTGRPAKMRLTKNIERGLIERTSTGNGRGLASVYALRLDSQYFPDRAPGGEWLIEKPLPDDGEKRCCLDSTIPNPKPCRETGKTVLSDNQNRAVKSTKPCCGKPETVLSRQQDTIRTPEEHQTHTHVPPGATKSKSEGVCKSSSYDQAMKYIHDDMLASQMDRRTDEKGQIEKRIAEHGWEKFVAAQHLYWQEQDPQFFSRTVFKWTAFLNGFSAWLSRVTPELLNILAHERWISTPEGAAEYERQINASISAQIVAEEKAAAIAAARMPPKSPYEIEQERKDAVVHDAIQRFLAGEEVMAPPEMMMEEIPDCYPTISGVRHPTLGKVDIERDPATGTLRIAGGAPSPM
jgi:hypothetical protein